MIHLVMSEHEADIVLRAIRLEQRVSTADATLVCREVGDRLDNAMVAARVPVVPRQVAVAVPEKKAGRLSTGSGA